MSGRDAGRSLCYGIEIKYAHLARQLMWPEVMRLCHDVHRDIVVRDLYPELTRRKLRIRPTGPGDTGGFYRPDEHRIRVALDCMHDLAVLHELAHACLGGKEDAPHGVTWRNCFLLLLARHGSPGLFDCVHGTYLHANLLTTEKGR